MSRRPISRAARWILPLAWFSLALLSCDAVFDIVPPKIKIIEPKEDTAYFGTLPVELQVTDNNEVEKVEVFLDDASVHEFTREPYKTEIDLGGISANTLKVVAYDRGGNWAEKQQAVSTPRVFDSTFFDDFEDGDFSDWTVAQSNWSITSPGYESSYCLSSSGGKNNIIAPFIGWVGTYELDYKISGSGVSDFVIRFLQTTTTGDSLTFYDVGLYPNGGDDRNRIGRSIKGEFTYLFQNSSSNDNLTDLNTWTHAKIERTSSGEINVYIDGTLNMSVIDRSISEPGYFLITDYNRTSFDNPSYAYLPISSTGLVAYYSFNGNANDESGNGNHGTVNGASLAADRFGNANSAYSFDGVDDYIDLLLDGALFDSTITITAWAYRTKSLTANYQQGIVSNDWSSDRGLNINAAMNNYVAFQVTVPGQTAVGTGSSAPLPESEWTLVAMTYDGASVKGYIDGVIDGSGNVSGRLTGTGIFRIGHHPYGTSTQRYWGGLLDDIRIYGRALSATEIQALYNEGGWDANPSVSGRTGK